LKILNIDAFVTPKRQLAFGGKTFAVKELSVQQFINNLKAVEQLEEARKAGSGSVSDFMELTIASIHDAIPDLPMEQLRGLPVDAVTLIAEFVRGDHDPDKVAPKVAVAPNTGEGTEDAKKS
jgi:hypothetical protein